MAAPVIEFGFKEADRPAIVALFREYWAAIGLAPTFQNFESEVAGLPGEYAPPRGQMIVARDAGDGSLVACVSLRPFPEPGCCEMKRLYVRPVARGTGLGRRLALAVMDEGRRLGYTRMCLDTLPTLQAAQALYLDLGFRHTGMAATDPPTLLFACELGSGA